MSASSEYSCDASLGAVADADGRSSPLAPDDTSLPARADAVCLWCETPIGGGTYCSKTCRQWGFRARRLLPSLEYFDVASLGASADVVQVPASPGAARDVSGRARQARYRARCVFRKEGRDALPRRLRISDPPYPGKAFLYRAEPTFGGEVDHARLLESLTTFDGWVLATSAEALRDVLALCPRGTRVASWHKPHGAQSTTRGAHNCWEPILYWPAREFRPGFPDTLVAHAARSGGTLIGRKPIAWVAFVIKLLGALPIDTLDDEFPGTGVVGRVWRQFTHYSSLPPRGDAVSARSMGDASPRYRSDKSRAVARDGGAS